MAGDFVVRVRVDEDYLRLVTYRAVLQEIAKDEDGEPWAVHPYAELAREILRRFGDEGDD